MIPYDVDPTLYSVQPEIPLLDDGFSPPHAQEADNDGEPGPASAHEEPGLGPKSPF